MKTVAYYALHYGSEYLAWSIRSIKDAVDEIHVLYSEKPSFIRSSHQRWRRIRHERDRTRLQCPDTEARLLLEARRFLGDHNKLHWHRVDGARTEGEHRDRLRSLVKTDFVVHVDADEVWDTASLINAIDRARAAGIYSLRARFLHFWRSFNWVCEDAAWPERIFNWRDDRLRLTMADGGRVDMTEHLSISEQPIPVLHFGYAQSEALTHYKWEVHGHQHELRPDWLEQKFLPWRPGIVDVHPTCVDFWSPKPTPDELKPVLQRLLGDHPYFGKELIR